MGPAPNTASWPPVCRRGAGRLVADHRGSAGKEPVQGPLPAAAGQRHHGTWVGTAAVGSSNRSRHPPAHPPSCRATTACANAVCLHGASLAGGQGAHRRCRHPAPCPQPRPGVQRAAAPAAGAVGSDAAGAAGPGGHRCGRRAGRCAACMPGGGCLQSQRANLCSPEPFPGPRQGFGSRGAVSSPHAPRPPAASCRPCQAGGPQVPQPPWGGEERAAGGRHARQDGAAGGPGGRQLAGHPHQAWGACLAGSHAPAGGRCTHHAQVCCNGSAQRGWSCVLQSS